MIVVDNSATIIQTWRGCQKIVFAEGLDAYAQGVLEAREQNGDSFIRVAVTLCYDFLTSDALNRQDFATNSFSVFLQTIPIWLNSALRSRKPSPLA
jgi:hypothetical protein